jgi:hypothetical protein
VKSSAVESNIGEIAIHLGNVAAESRFHLIKKVHEEKKVGTPSPSTLSGNKSSLSRTSMYSEYWPDGCCGIDSMNHAIYQKTASSNSVVSIHSQFTPLHQILISSFFFKYNIT